MTRTATIALGTCKQNSAMVEIELCNTWSQKNSDKIAKAILAVIERIEIASEIKDKLVNTLTNLTTFEMKENVEYQLMSATKKFNLKLALTEIKVRLQFK